MNKSYYNPHIDGLRGIAILLVIGYHYFSGFHFLDIGWSGVDLFFVLSGYLLTGRLYPYVTDKKLLGKFYFNRILRIIPLYYLFLALFFLCWYGLASNDTIAAIPGYHYAVPATFSFLTNWLFIRHFPVSYEHLNHLWSLAVEEQFYLLFPLLVILIRKKKALLITGVLLIMTVFVSRWLYSLTVPPDEFLKIHWNTFFHADSFLAGFVLYMLIENGYNTWLVNRYSWICCVCFLLLATGMYVQGSMRIGYFFTGPGFTLIAVLYAGVLLSVISEQHNLIKKISASSFLRYSGKISFGLYIFHWPVFLSGFKITKLILSKLHAETGANSIQLINALLSAIVVYAICTVSFRYYESFFLKWKLKPRNISKTEAVKMSNT